jgi:hypothetical protein
MNRFIVVFACFFISCSAPEKRKFFIPAEFEPQEFIWLSWMESGFLPPGVYTLQPCVWRDPGGCFDDVS